MRTGRTPKETIHQVVLVLFIREAPKASCNFCARHPKGLLFGRMPWRDSAGGTGVRDLRTRRRHGDGPGGRQVHLLAAGHAEAGALGEALSQGDGSCDGCERWLGKEKWNEPVLGSPEERKNQQLDGGLWGHSLIPC